MRIIIIAMITINKKSNNTDNEDNYNDMIVMIMKIVMPLVLLHSKKHPGQP